MTNADKILWAFQRNSYRLTLGQVLQHDYGYKFTSRLSDLRKRGYKIDCIIGKTPSENLYVMEMPADDNGQMRFA